MKLTIEVPKDTATMIQDHIANLPKNEYNTHGPLTFKSLVEMLVEDVGLSIRRPGSWEGRNMETVLSAHGYPW